MPYPNDPGNLDPAARTVPQPGAEPVHENDPRRAEDPSRLTQPELDPNRSESGRWEDVGNTDDDLYEPVPDDSVKQTEEIAFLNGNRNTPVLLLGDDPGNEANETDNVLIVNLGTAVSVPRNTVGDLEGTAEDGSARNEDREDVAERY